MRKLNVNTAMSRPQKSIPQAKRVTPPAVPSSDLHNRNSGVPGNFVSGTTNTNCSNINTSGGGGCSSSNVGNHPRINCPGYSSLLEDGGFTQTRESPAALSIKDEIIEYTTSTQHQQQSSVNNIVTVVNTNKSPSNLNTYVTPTAFTFPISGRGEPLTHKAAVFYHQQLALQEDQGIDLTQSPGRDSPGSSSGSAGSGSRHSTASLDSGRASSYITGGGGSTASTRGALSSPRCSVSSCSIGSVDRMSQRSDNDIIIEWLSDMKFDEYAQLFTAAGYDLPTITRMTPEDLTAIGIKNPHHRERIKQHIDNLQLPDGLPNFVPGSIEEWLRLLRLEEYIQPLLDQNYKTVRDVTQVTWEDLEDIGIVKLGHQKKILLAIKRVKDIISGKWNLKGGNNQQHQQQSIPTSSSAQKEYNNVHHHNNIFFQNNNNNFYNNHHQNCGVNNNNINNKLVCGSQQQHHYQQQHSRISWDDSRSQEIYKEYSGVNHESNDIVLIKIRQPRGKSLESLEDISERNTRTHLTFSHYSTDYTYFPQHMQMHPVHQMQQQQQLSQLQNPGINKHLCMNSTLPYHIGNLQWRRSYDDGDITPTNEIASDLNEGGGTLPRQRSSNPSARSRLLDNCSVVGSLLPGSTCSNNIGINIISQQSNLINSSSDYKSCSSQQDNVILMSNAVRYSTGCSPLPSKKTAPEPPRRQCSVRQTGRSSSVPEQTIILSQQHQQQQQQQQQQYYIHQQHQQNNSNISSCRNSQQYIPSQHFQQQIQQQPIYVNYSTVHQTTAEIHCDKTNESKSNSSIDSIDTIPFANENTGTIKQRLLNRQEISSSLSLSSSSSSSSSTNTVANIAQSFSSLKTSGSLHETTLHNSGSNNISCGGSTNSGNNSADHTPPSPTVPSSPNPTDCQQQHLDSYQNLHHHHSELDDDCGETSSVTCSVDRVIVPKSGSNNNDGTIITNSINPNDSVNVLNDIGNMLANLTDELDAMLEEEKRVGISDSE